MKKKLDRSKIEELSVENLRKVRGGAHIKEATVCAKSGQKGSPSCD